MITWRFALKKLLQIGLHCIFWLGVLLFYTHFFGFNETTYKDTLLFSLFLMPITIATTYVSIYKLIPEYFITKKYWLFALYSLYTFIISSYLVMVSVFFSLIYLANFDYGTMNPSTRNLLLILTAIYLITFVVSAFKLLKLNSEQQAKNNQLETKILETQLKLKEQELNYLKMQIHPHFLFNTLNTMYGFALKKADETPEMILKLSNLLDYLLYQVDKPFVSLEDEIHHIEDYISLEQLRFNETLKVSFTKNITSNNLKIPPMLFIPFVENSFKHGSIKNGILSIDIVIKATSSTIEFKIKNSSSKDSNNNEGIGLSNIKKRLELLYPEQHILGVQQKDKDFLASLILKIKN